MSTVITTTTPKGTGDLAGNLGVDRLKRSVADEIFFVEANAMPLTAMIRGARKIVVPAIKREWLEDELYPETFLVASTGSTTTQATMTSPTVAAQIHVGDMLYDTTQRETARAIAISGANVTTTPALTAAWTGGTSLIRIGNAMTQGSSRPDLKQTVEVVRTNYMQRFRKPFSLTIETQHSAMYGEDEKALEKREKLIELMREMERTNLLSNAAVAGTQVQNGTATVAEGVYGFLNTNAPPALVNDQTGSQLLDSELNTFVRNTFINRGDSQATTKVLFAAPSIVEDIQGFSSVSGAMRFGAGDTKFGVKVGSWQTSFGSIGVVPHPMLASAGTNTNQNMAFLLDMSQVAQCVMEGLDLQYTEIDKKKTTNEEVIEGEWSISQCIQIKGSTGLHGVLLNVAD